jgi:hypothetical protein
MDQFANTIVTSPDRVLEVINNVNENSFESLYPKYAVAGR